MGRSVDKTTEERACERDVDPHITDNGAGLEVRFTAFDTIVSMKAFGDPAKIEQALRKAFKDCRTYEDLFSRTLPTSDIGRFNAAEGEPVAIDARTANLLQAAIRYSKASGGVFDITIAPVVALWDIKHKTIPSEAALKEALTHVGIEKLDVWAQCGGNWFARLSDPSAAVDLGGIAKGWIADKLADSLMRAGATGIIIDLGGNIVVRGKRPEGGPWRVGIREPIPSEEDPGVLQAIEVDDGSLVTSGIYERCFMSDGKRYHHILNPKTGYPVDTEWTSVSVLAKRSLDAEGFSTTLLALGPDKSRDLSREHPEILQAYFVDLDGNIEPLR